MAENLQDLRRRINSVKNTRKITQAMKTVSAAKLGRSVSRLKRVRPMMEKIDEMLSRVSSAPGTKENAFLQKRDSGETVIAVIASDKGLCGSFNSHVIERAQEFFDQLREEGENPTLITLGTKADNYFKKREYPIKKSYKGMMSSLEYSDVKELSAYLQEIYLDESKGIKQIEFIYTGFLSASQQEITVATLFPIERAVDLPHDDAAPDMEPPGQKEAEGDEEKDEVKFILEPSARELFDALLPRYIDSLIYRILLESSASEHAARMIAMELATNNAQDMIKELTLTLNKLRQASITNELLEIITATEALNK